MKKCLYFICPTDGLEFIINGTFHHENYFYSSLGNSVTFNDDDLNQTKKLICNRGIREISFVLSDDNRIVLDALGSQDFSNIKGLKKFYDQVIIEKKQLEMSWQILHPQFSILSSFLNHKIEDLKNGLSDLMIGEITLNGKIYRKKEHTFDDVFSHTICQEEFILN